MHNHYPSQACCFFHLIVFLFVITPLIGDLSGPRLDCTATGKYLRGELGSRIATTSHGHYGVSNHRQHGSLFSLKTEKASKLFISGLLWGVSPMTDRFFSRSTSDAESASMPRYLHGSTPVMMTSSNRNIFRVTDLCEGNSPVLDGFPSHRPLTRSFDVFFSWANVWENNWDTGDLRRHDAHYNVTVTVEIYTGRFGTLHVLKCHFTREYFNTSVYIAQHERFDMRHNYCVGCEITKKKCHNYCKICEITKKNDMSVCSRFNWFVIVWFDL